jgi:hypothetical protein
MPNPLERLRTWLNDLAEAQAPPEVCRIENYTCHFRSFTGVLGRRLLKSKLQNRQTAADTVDGLSRRVRPFGVVAVCFLPMCGRLTYTSPYAWRPAPNYRLNIPV